MPDFKSDAGFGEPSLDDVRRSDDFIEALAAGRQAVPQDDADAALAALLGEWRDEIRRPPAADLVTEPEAVSALNAGLGEKRFRRAPNSDDLPTVTRGRRGLSVVGAAAAAVLCIGGFGAVVTSAGPGDALYGLRTMLFGASKQVREDQVGLAARTELNQVQELISQGDWAQAQQRLVAVSSQVASVDDAGQKQELIEQFNDLSAKVVGRDPNASAPPGVTYTVPPSSTELVPTAVPTSVPGAPSLSDGSTSVGPVPSEDATPSETDPSSDTGAADTPPVSVAPGQTTTPTSALPTSGPAAGSQSAVPPSTTESAPAPLPAGASAPQPTVASAPQSTAASAPQSAPQSTVAETGPEVPHSGSAVITTPVVIPEPTG